VIRLIALVSGTAPPNARRSGFRSRRRSISSDAPTTVPPAPPTETAEPNKSRQASLPHWATRDSDARPAAGHVALLVSATERPSQQARWAAGSARTSGTEHGTRAIVMPRAPPHPRGRQGRRSWIEAATIPTPMLPWLVTATGHDGSRQTGQRRRRAPAPIVLTTRRYPSTPQAVTPQWRPVCTNRRRQLTRREMIALTTEQRARAPAGCCTSSRAGG
jgi:hypothetical protein